MSFFSALRHTALKDVDRHGKPLPHDVVCLAANATGSRVVSSRTDKSVSIWKVLSLTIGEPTVIDSAHAGPTRHVCWLPATDTAFATVGGDAFVKIWTATGALSREIKVGKSARCVLVEFSPDGAVMAVVLDDGSVAFYNDNYEWLLLLRVAHVSCLRWTNTGHAYFVVGLDSGNVDVYSFDPKLGAVRAHTLAQHKLAVTCLAVDPRGKYIAAGTSEGIVSFFSTGDFVNSGVLAQVDQEVSSLVCSRDGYHVVVGFAQDSNTKVYSVDSGAEVYELPNSAAGKTGLQVVWLANKGMIVYSADKGRAIEYARKEVRK